MSDPQPVYKRILLKLSGEALAGKLQSGFDSRICQQIASDIKKVHDAGIETAIVVGGGNIFRGTLCKELGIERVAGDQMGMFATIINGIALQQALANLGCKATIFSSLSATDHVPAFCWEKAMAALDRNEIVICVGGTGNPYFTTDTNAALRAAQLKADVLLKASDVDGVYDKDPNVHADAKRFERVSYRQVIADELKVMDLTAIAMCRENHIPVKVFAVSSLWDAVSQPNFGTVVE